MCASQSEGSTTEDQPAGRRARFFCDAGVCPPPYSNIDPRLSAETASETKDSDDSRSDCWKNPVWPRDTACPFRCQEQHRPVERGYVTYRDEGDRQNTVDRMHLIHVFARIYVWCPSQIEVRDRPQRTEGPSQLRVALGMRRANTATERSAYSASTSIVCTLSAAIAPRNDEMMDSSTGASTESTDSAVPFFSSRASCRPAMLTPASPSTPP